MQTIANQIVNWQLHALKARNIDLAPVYRSIGIEQAALDKPGHLLTAEQFALLMRKSFELVNDEAAGYTQKPLRVGTFRMMCHATIDCHNLRRAFIRVIDFFRLLSDEYDWSLKEQGEEALLTLNCRANGIVDNSYFIASMMTILWRWASWMIDSPILLSRIRFAFSENTISPVNDDELSRIFRCEIDYRQTNNQLIIPVEYLNQPIKQQSDSLTGFLANTPECLLSHYQSETSFSAQVKQYLETVNELENISLDSVAEFFDISGQTLARNLRKEDHQFQQLKDKVRKNRAVNLLLRSELSISEISHQLGFSEDSVFYRNFKKWTGCTPSDYRHNHRSD